MIGFAIKKAFFDFWDHLFFAVIVNSMYTLILVSLAGLMLLGADGHIGPVLVALPGIILVLSLMGGLANFWGRDLAQGRKADWKNGFLYLRESWKMSLAYGAIWILIFAGLAFGLDYYYRLNQFAGVAFQVLMIWLVVFTAGMGLFYPGMGTQGGERQLKLLVQKSFFLFAANPLLSLFLGLLTGLMILLSVVTLGFFPGVLGISLWLQVCYRFLMARYRWLEKHPEANRKTVPWAEILEDDLNRLGPRTLRGMLFPWKH